MVVDAARRGRSVGRAREMRAIRDESRGVSPTRDRFRKRGPQWPALKKERRHQRRRMKAWHEAKSNLRPDAPAGERDLSAEEEPRIDVPAMTSTGSTGNVSCCCAAMRPAKRSSASTRRSTRSARVMSGPTFGVVTRRCVSSSVVGRNDTMTIDLRRHDSRRQQSGTA